MQYELWDVDGANLVGFFATEAEALNLVREMIETYGPDSVETYVLSSVDQEGVRNVIAGGVPLTRRAEHTPQRLTSASSTV
jgi:hypothetical protein